MIKEEICKEKIYTRQQAIAIANAAMSSEEKFAELMQCFLSHEYRLAQRAAWSVNYAAQQHPQLIVPYVKDLVAQLTRTDVHDAVIRNSVRILKNISIPEAFHGEVMNACFVLAEKPTTPVAIKAFSLTTLYRLSLVYPEIQQELQTLIETQYDHESAAFKACGKKILQQLHKRKTPGINHQTTKINQHCN